MALDIVNRRGQKPRRRQHRRLRIEADHGTGNPRIVLLSFAEGDLREWLGRNLRDPRGRGVCPRCRRTVTLTVAGVTLNHRIYRPARTMEDVWTDSRGRTWCRGGDGLPLPAGEE